MIGNRALSCSYLIELSLYVPASVYLKSTSESWSATFMIITIWLGFLNSVIPVDEISVVNDVELCPILFRMLVKRQSVFWKLFLDYGYDLCNTRRENITIWSKVDSFVSCKQIGTIFWTPISNAFASMLKCPLQIYLFVWYELDIYRYVFSTFYHQSKRASEFSRL